MMLLLLCPSQRQNRQRPLLTFLPPPPQPSPATKHHWRSFDLRMVQCWWSVAATSSGHRLRRRSISLWLRLPLKRQYVSPWPMGAMTFRMLSARTWFQLAVPLQRPRQFTLLQLHPPLHPRAPPKKRRCTWSLKHRRSGPWRTQTFG